MTSLGKQLRLRRVFHPKARRCILFAVSHGTSTPEIFRQFSDTPGLVRAALAGGADSVLISKGFLAASAEVLSSFPDAAPVLKVSATGRENVPREVMTYSVEGAVRAGADAVGVLMQLTPWNESTLLPALAQLGEDCEAWQMPYLIEAELPAAYSGEGAYVPEDPVAYLRRCCRLAQELGADVIKTNWTGSPDSYGEVLEVVSVPVVVAGGSRTSDEEFLQMVREALEAGASGVSVGRNIFQAADPEGLMRRLSDVVHASPVAARV